MYKESLVVPSSAVLFSLAYWSVAIICYFDYIDWKIDSIKNDLIFQINPIFETPDTICYKVSYCWQIVTERLSELWPWLEIWTVVTVSSYVILTRWSHDHTCITLTRVNLLHKLCISSVKQQGILKEYFTTHNELEYVGVWKYCIF